MRARTIAAGPELAVAAGGPPDWQHAAAIDTGVAADPERWARSCFEGAPLAMRHFLTIGWRLLLLQGSPRSDATHVLGWPLVASSPATAVLQRRSNLGIMATLVFSVETDRAIFASGMRFENRAARILWAVVAPTHRWAVRTVLGHAAAHLH
jgi:hypothetical protein